MSGAININGRPQIGYIEALHKVITELEDERDQLKAEVDDLKETIVHALSLMDSHPSTIGEIRQILRDGLREIKMSEMPHACTGCTQAQLKINDLTKQLAQSEKLKQMYKETTHENAARVEDLTKQLEAVYLEMRKQRPSIKAVFDREVCVKAWAPLDREEDKDE